MKKTSLKYQLFDLPPQKFEELCADLLNAEYQFDKFYISDPLNDQAIDILALKGIKKIAIQIKHRYKIPVSQIVNDIQRLTPHLEYHHEFIYLTSANLPQSAIVKLESDKIRIIAQNELLELLDKHSDVAQRYFSAVEKKIKTTRHWLSAGTLGLVVSMVFSLATFVFQSKSKDQSLATRIENVEQALKIIKSLEGDLQGIKSDMIETDLENKEILAEYERMQGLEDIVNERKESLNNILSYQPWYRKALGYFLGIITGIFTSIVGSILFERWKLKRELNK